MDLDLGDDLDLTRYLEGELATDREHISSISPGKRSALEHAKATLDRESLNFFDFMKFKMGIAVPTSPRSHMGSPVVGRLDRITFATLMPHESTTRAVATQALVNVLTLATKGVIRLHQDRNGAGWGGDGYGEIHLRFSGI
jgi:meiotic recombination protein REC8